MARSRKPSNRLRGAPVANQSLPRERRSLGARWSAWTRQHRQSFQASLRRLLIRPWSTALTVLVMGIALALPLLLFVMLDNARSLSGGLREARDFTVFLKTSQSIEAAQKFSEELGKRADVAATSLRTPEQGLTEFRQLSGFSEALDVLEDNPLPSVIVVTPQRLESTLEPPLLAELRSDPRVDMVQYDAEWRKRLSAILGFGERAMLSLTVLLGLATLLVVGNTVRMDIQTRGEEIAVVQLMGASDGFVRRPFLYAGLWYGVLGGILAVLAVGIVELVVRAPLLDLMASYQNRFSLHGFGWCVAMMVISASALLGWLGAWIVSTRHLFAGRPQR
ncbi:MAG TPA: permease-like cell division protein FtsX [Dokdonella sp.]|uniref:permease-like cell division protein FtsX n=1 Tax=Dokdonella sp. TaxID=2291710 RepID=UPI002D7EB1D6|nr:permease-like cell division protein FtsX [Dokdonella sp.]HET9031639.1 permease-like cell division protein FtsX [Dokdonella sp.]